jgi:hypothetical protein
MTTALSVTGCLDCPFAEEMWAGCNHPEVSKETSLAVSGITDAALKRGATPEGCPLRSGVTTISLKAKKAKAS